MTARALFTRENAEDDADDLNAADENGGLEPEPETKDEAAREGKPIVAAAEREPERYRALFDCPAEEPEDLEFFKGDEILVTGKVSAPSRIHNCSCRFLSHGVAIPGGRVVHGHERVNWQDRHVPRQLRNRSNLTLMVLIVPLPV